MLSCHCVWLFGESFAFFCAVVARLNHASKLCCRHTMQPTIDYDGDGATCPLCTSQCRRASCSFIPCVLWSKSESPPSTRGSPPLWRLCGATLPPPPNSFGLYGTPFPSGAKTLGKIGGGATSPLKDGVGKHGCRSPRPPEEVSLLSRGLTAVPL